MKKITLSENHRRSVSSSVHIIEKMLIDIENVKSNPDNGTMIRTINDIEDLDEPHFRNAIDNIKSEIRYLAEKYNLKPEEIKMSRIINSRKAKMWETVTDTNSRKLKGFKEFPKELADEFDKDIARLKATIDAL
jgi:hypothetical protein